MTPWDCLVCGEGAVSGDICPQCGRNKGGVLPSLLDRIASGETTVEDADKVRALVEKATDAMNLLRVSSDYTERMETSDDLRAAIAAVEEA